MSRDASMRAQEAWNRYCESTMEYYQAESADDGSKQHAKTIRALQDAMQQAATEYSKSHRTEQLVASGDAVDTPSLLDGAL